MCPDTRPVPTRMDLPTWLIEILRQFPMVVVIGLAVWYAEKRVREKELRLENRFDTQLAETLRRGEEREQQLRDREDKLRAEIRHDRDAEIARFTEAQKAVADANAKLLAAKDEQIAGLTEQVQNLAKQLAALTKKLQG
jgi:DNA anti-recombination protein RmuC